jgi:hypothetical protein
MVFFRTLWGAHQVRLSFGAGFAQTRGEEMADTDVSGTRSPFRANDPDNRRATKCLRGRNPDLFSIHWRMNAIPKYQSPHRSMMLEHNDFRHPL